MSWIEDLKKFGERVAEDIASGKYKNRDKYIDSIDLFIKQNPKIKGINTSDFRDFFIKLVGSESTYNPKAKQGSHYGYYQIRNLGHVSAEQQHKAAFDHLLHLFQNSITDMDIEKARNLGFGDAATLAKYWNNENNVSNFLHKGVDKKDGLGTKISEYGNNYGINLDIMKYVPEAITDAFVIVKSGDSIHKFVSRARNADIDYSNREKSIQSFQSPRIRKNSQGKIDTLPFDFTKIRPGDTLFLSNPKKDANNPDRK